MEKGVLGCGTHHQAFSLMSTLACQAFSLACWMYGIPEDSKTLIRHHLKLLNTPKCVLMYFVRVSRQSHG